MYCGDTQEILPSDPKIGLSFPLCYPDLASQLRNRDKPDRYIYGEEGQLCIESMVFRVQKAEIKAGYKDDLAATMNGKDGKPLKQYA